MIGGSQFLHGVMEIFTFIKPIESIVVNAKDFFYSMSGEFLINGVGLVIIAVVYLAQTARKKKYGDMSLDQIHAMLQTK